MDTLSLVRETIINLQELERHLSAENGQIDESDAFAEKFCSCQERLQERKRVAATTGEAVQPEEFSYEGGVVRLYPDPKSLWGALEGDPLLIPADDPANRQVGWVTSDGVWHLLALPSLRNLPEGQEGFVEKIMQLRERLRAGGAQ